MLRLLLLNIKLAITNLYKYAMGRKVALPGDAVTEQEAGHTEAEVTTSVPGGGLEQSCQRLIGEEVQSQRRPLLGPSPG